MPKPIVLYVRYIDKSAEILGRLTMYMVVLMVLVLIINAVTRNVINYPLSWCILMAQFLMTAYYFLGGAYSMQLGDHVRMDLIYDRCSERTKAKLDILTTGCLLFYLVCLFVGSISSTMYAIEYDQRKFSAWNPSMIPIKVIMVFGIIMMILQTISIFFKDIAFLRGEPIGDISEKPVV